MFFSRSTQDATEQSMAILKDKDYLDTLALPNGVILNMDYAMSSSDSENDSDGSQRSKASSCMSKGKRVYGTPTWKTALAKLYRKTLRRVYLWYVMYFIFIYSFY